MSKRARNALASGLGIVAMTVTYLAVPWEGVETTAYWDKLGKVWTVCAGETLGVKKGDKYTYDQCIQMIHDRMEKDYHQPLKKCIKGFDKMPMSVQGTFLSASWNLGVHRICTSTAAKHARAKQWKNACETMTWFNQAGGKVVRGLDLRRKDGDSKRMGEREFCLTGLEPSIVVLPTPKVEPSTERVAETTVEVKPVALPPAPAKKPEPLTWWQRLFWFGR